MQARCVSSDGQDVTCTRVSASHVNMRQMDMLMHVFHWCSRSGGACRHLHKLNNWHHSGRVVTVSSARAGTQRPSSTCHHSTKFIY